MNEKIRPQHRARAAYVYVRQSTIQQVRDHQESRRQQLALAEKARHLGFAGVTVIDEDLGRSGSGLQDRPGFARLLTAVCQGLAGAVFALEASRLARNNRDWHHLIDLCAIADSLLVDADGVYDPRVLNDRLLLGLKGSLAEFELGLMRQRARAAYLQKVQRGHTLWEPAVGYVRTEEQLIEKIADRQVQEAVAAMFRRFRELGSARQVTLWYTTEGVLLPQAKPGTAGREIEWRLPCRQRVAQMLKNPCYAGAFAYGRTRVRTVVEDGRAKRASRCRQARPDWKVLILDHHSAYITWDEYLENQRLLETNLNMKGGSTAGAAKRGSALLTGLLRCGRCGNKLFTRYGGQRGDVPRFVCRGERRHHAVPECLSVGGLRVEQAVCEAVLEAVQPAGVEAALMAWDQIQLGQDEKRQSLQLALEKARYEVDRARRQYDGVDPANRLVAGELEARWNAALSHVLDLEARLTEVDQSHRALSPEDRRRLLDLGRDLQSLWRHPAAGVDLKKRILRTVLTEIVIDTKGDRHELRLHWNGGVHTELKVRRNVRGQHHHTTGADALALIRELSKVCNDRVIASILNRLGYRTGKGNTWQAGRVAQARHYHKFPNYEKERDWLTLDQASHLLKVSSTVIRRLIADKTLPAQQVVKHAPWIIRRDDLSRPEVGTAIAAVNCGHRLPRTVRGQRELPFEPGTL